MTALAENRLARYEFDLLEKYEAGLKLTGAEVKAVRDGNVSLKGAHVNVRPTGAALLNAHIGRYKPAGPDTGYDERRSRPILLHKRELQTIFGRTSREPLTVIPLRLYTVRGLIKIEIALARRRKTHEKREVIKKREISREIRKIVS